MRAFRPNLLPHKDVADDAPQNVVRLPSSDLSDPAIVRAVRVGHPAGAAVLFERYHGHVRGVLIRVLGRDPEVSDLVQEVFLTAIDSIGKLERPESLRGWLASVAVFTARGRLRRRTRWRFLRFVANEDLPEVGVDSPDPEIDEAARATYRVFDRMPVEERIVFALRFIEEMEMPEIATACSTSLSTAKRRLRSATLRFRRLAAREPALDDWLDKDTRCPR